LSAKKQHSSCSENSKRKPWAVAELLGKHSTQQLQQKFNTAAAAKNQWVHPARLHSSHQPPSLHHTTQHTHLPDNYTWTHSPFSQHTQTSSYTRTNSLFNQHTHLIYRYTRTHSPLSQHTHLTNSYTRTHSPFNQHTHLTYSYTWTHSPFSQHTQKQTVTPEGAGWGNVQICALFALWIHPFTAHSANWHHSGFKWKLIL
jgi:hypothetical protein